MDDLGGYDLSPPPAWMSVSSAVCPESQRRLIDARP